MNDVGTQTSAYLTLELQKEDEESEICLAYSAMTGFVHCVNVMPDPHPLINFNLDLAHPSINTALHSCLLLLL